MEFIDVLKYVLLFGTAPLWLPFVKAVWAEFIDSLRMDGGLWGATPTPVQREEIRRQIEREMPRQVHEPKASYRQSGKAKSGPRQPAGRSGGPAAGPQSGSSGGAFRKR